MTFHPSFAGAPTTNRSDVFRRKAMLSEQRARESTNERSKLDWEELAIEWHMMANLAAEAHAEIPRTNVL